MIPSHILCLQVCTEYIFLAFMGTVLRVAAIPLFESRDARMRPMTPETLPCGQKVTSVDAAARLQTSCRQERRLHP